MEPPHFIKPLPSFAATSFAATSFAATSFASKQKYFFILFANNIKIFLS
jgi:hypothetical protein